MGVEAGLVGVEVMEEAVWAMAVGAREMEGLGMSAGLCMSIAAHSHRRKPTHC